MNMQVAGMNTPVSQRSGTITARSNKGRGSNGVNGRSPGTGASPVFTARTPPDGQATVAYTYTYVATGSPAPTFSVVAGTLPTGLTLNATTGVLAGTPSSAATFSFTVRATNSFYPAVDAAESVVIAAAP